MAWCVNLFGQCNNFSSSRNSYLCACNMARILSIDYGTIRVGLAVTDPLQIIANGLTSIDESKTLDFLRQYIKDEEVELILLGLPLQLDGSKNTIHEQVVGFRQKLEKAFPNIPVEYVDERYTSKMASQVLIDSGVKKKKRKDKGLLDQISATIMLQDYLNSKTS